MRTRFLSLLPVLAIATAAPASAQGAPPPPEGEQIVLMRSVLDALRQNTAALGRSAAVMETFSSRLERVEAATRSVPPSVEGLRTDIIAIRAGLERLVAGAGQRRAPATLRFAPFACGNEGEASCAVNACKSVGYQNGFGITVNRTGTGTAVKPTSVADATCYD